jgi:chromate transporter
VNESVQHEAEKPSEPGAGNQESTPPSDYASRLREVAIFFFRLGWTAFGGPAAHIAMMRDEVVKRRKWVSEERFLDLLGLANVIPGPSSTELAIYLGYQRAGLPGLALAGTLFILPAMLIVLVFAWLYTRIGALPQVSWAFYGVKPVIIAIILQALVGLARTAFKSRLLIAAGLVAFAVELLSGNAVLVIFGTGIVVALILRGPDLWRSLRQRRTAGEQILSLALVSQWGKLKVGMPRRAGIWFARLAVVAPAVGLVPLFLEFLKIGAVTYGSGYTLLAFLQGDLVSRLHWITDRQLLDAVAVGQFTPGPVFTTATFIGYLTDGVPGALVATAGIFLPAFVLCALLFPLGGRIRRSALASAFLDGVNVAAIALIAAVLLQLARAALVDWVTVAIAAVALLILLRFRINSAWLVLGGAAVGTAIYLLHLPL